ncbi:MAG: FAD binding domain-containing protein [Eubacterium sp.]|nr:FAD binding domain-containing protein [Eubacterium sp.]
MISFKEYLCPDTIEEAYELTQKKSNIIIGGMLWVKMKKNSYNAAIDLSKLGLTYIKEEEDGFHIGAMTSLREIETSNDLKVCFGECFGEALKGIVGVQFRNSATLGGSIYGRYGFSDVFTLFLAMGAKVKLFKGGIMTLEEFKNLPRSYKDVLTEVIVPKNTEKTVYMSQRNTRTDFPVVTCALCLRGGKMYCAIGARPKIAELFIAEDEKIPEDMEFSSNIRASEKYRKQIANVLLKRCINKVKEGV